MGEHIVQLTGEMVPTSQQLGSSFLGGGTRLGDLGFGNP
jgi:hypothetical protein